MSIVYVHASKFGNGAEVAAEFARLMNAEGEAVQVQHIRDVDPGALPPAELYVFSSPGRMGKPPRRVRRFLGKVNLPAGTRFALVSTEMAPRPDKRTGQVPSAEERARSQRIIPLMREALAANGLRGVAEATVYVEGLRGPLEAGWRDKVSALVNALDTVGPSASTTTGGL